MTKKQEKQYWLLRPMKNKAGFTLLELLLVLVLILLVFGVIGFSFTTNIKGNVYLSQKINKTVEQLSIYNQISKQFFSGYTGKAVNIKLDKERLSFYTFYPVFYSGAVRAEYYIETSGNKKKLIYEEFPYVDGKLGFGGLKRIVLGTFDNISFEAFNRNRFYSSFTGKVFPRVLKVTLDRKDYYIFSGRRD